jgi:xanthine dehydrogenase YagS FAD-binding subunit
VRELSYSSIDTKEIEKAFLWLNRYWNKPTQPLYYSPKKLNEVISLLEDYREQAKIIAGGIDVIGLLKNSVLSPRVLVNIKAVSSLSYITENDRGVEIGALTVLNDIKKSVLVRSKYPLLAEAAQSVGSPQIGNMATIGGNLCQEVRCWYYRRSPITGISYPCRRKREDGICYAVNGENENHAIFGEGDCFAVCPSDMATALLALEARIITISTSGGRAIPISKFYTNLGNTLKPNEIITSIQIPEVQSNTRQEYLKFRLRKTIDFAIASVALLITLNNNVIRDARIVVGGVSTAPYEAVKAEEVLRGELLTASVSEKAAKALVRDAMPLSKNGYKVPIVETLVKRALLK